MTTTKMPDFDDKAAEKHWGMKKNFEAITGPLCKKQSIR
jgi:hypothetical protein